MRDVDLPESLAHEGDMMLDALLADLREGDFDDIFCTRDSRLHKPGIDTRIVNPGEDVWQTWRRCMSEADAAWIIAPETGDILYKFSCLSQEKQSLYVGCRPEAVKLCSSKYRTLEFLGKNNVPSVPVLENTRFDTDENSGWIVKPDDGAGGEDCYLFYDPEALQKHISCLSPEKYIVQDYVRGTSASISMLCHKGKAVVLSCNEQLFDFRDGTGRLNGIVVNGLRQYINEFTKIAGRIAEVIAGLEGYVGVDLVISEDGPKILEINPRLTTAYAGLRESLGVNPAVLILETLQNGRFPDVLGLDYHPVTIRF